MKAADNWFTYDWQMGSEDAVLSVDMSLDKENKSLYPYCVKIKCESRDMNSEFLTPSERRHCEKVLKNALKAVELLFAGVEETDMRTVYYLYSAENDIEQELEKISRKERKVLMTYEIYDDEQWSIYYDVLYPDEAKKQTEENRNMIALLKKNGDCLIAPRRLNVLVAFSNELNLLSFESVAKSAGFAIGDRSFLNEYEKPYAVMLHRMSTIEKKAVDNITTRAVLCAEKFGGSLLYWDCAIVGRRR